MIGLSGPAGAGILELFARVSELDTRLRAIDPLWRGLSAASVAPAGAPSRSDPVQERGGTFAAALSTEAGRAGMVAFGRSAGAGSSAAPVELGMVDPLDGARVSQGFGPSALSLEPPRIVDGVRYDHFHDGLDLAAPLGATVRAAAAGVVVAAGRQPDGAVIVRIRHADGSETAYGHLAPDLAVGAGDRVSVGQRIGAVGLTGRTTGPHVHFTLVVDSRPIDPAPWLAAGRLPGATGAVAATGQPESAAPAAAAFDAVAGQIPYAAEIRGAALDAGIDPLLLASLVRTESGFRPDAVSPAGALGLAQLMPFNVRSLGVADPFDPGQNVRAAARYLANNLHLYGRVDLALAAYHAGKGAVARAGGIPDSPTTRGYVTRVLGRWSDYLEAAGAAGAVA